MEHAKRKNLQNLLQKLMVLVAVLLLIACFATGAPTESGKPSPQSVMWMISLGLCIGTVAFYIAGAKKPLEWVILASFIGGAICLGEIFGFSDNLVAPELFFGLYLSECLMAAGYGICRRR